MPAAKATGFLKEALKAKDIRPQDIDLGRLFCEAFGWNEFVACRSNDRLAHDVFESAGGVSTAAFTNISGQIVYSAFMEAYTSEEFVFTQLIPTISTKLSGEKIAGIMEIGDQATEVPETEAFPLVGVGEDYIETPATKKRGLIVPVTREAVFFDRTGILLERAGDVGKSLGVNKEIRAIDCMIDGNGPAKSIVNGGHRYHWRGTSYASYGDTNATTHPWDNLQATNTLTDWTNVNAAEQLLAQMTDPNTGLPFMIEAEDLVICNDLLHNAKRIVSATENRTGNYATTGNPNILAAPNTVKNYRIVSSRLLRQRMILNSDAATTWFLGTISKYAAYMENWGMDLRQAPTNSHDEFHRDIIQQFRADERGNFVVKQPRVMAKNTA